MIDGYRPPFGLRNDRHFAHSGSGRSVSYFRQYIFELIHAHAFGGSTQAINLERLEKRLKAHYKSTNATSQVLGKLNFERIKTSGIWPKLKAKADATRHLSLFALELAIEFDSGSPHDRRRVGVAQCLHEFYESIGAGGMFLSDDAKIRLPQNGRTLCDLYSQLSAEASAAGKRLWKFSPKHHLFYIFASGKPSKAETQNSIGRTLTRTWWAS